YSPHPTSSLPSVQSLAPLQWFTSGMHAPLSQRYSFSAQAGAFAIRLLGDLRAASTLPKMLIMTPKAISSNTIALDRSMIAP
ncbi:AAEL014223-PA, partial [Aedes aegypti]